MGAIQKGGARVGRGFWTSVNWTWPFATLEVDAEAVTLRLPFATHRLARANVLGVDLIGPGWAPPGAYGVVFRHNDTRVPPYVLFWSLDRPALIETLRESGYPLSLS